MGFIARARNLIGRRGAFLIVLGVLEVVIGWTLLTVPPVAFGPLTIFRAIPSDVRAGIWLVPGLLGVASAVSHRHLAEAFAFTISYLCLFVWGSFYFLSWAVFREMDFETSLRASTVYWAFAALVLVTSGWDEPLRRSERGSD